MAPKASRDGCIAAVLPVRCRNPLLRGAACSSRRRFCRQAWGWLARVPMPKAVSHGKKASRKLPPVSDGPWPGRAKAELKLAAINQSYKAGQQEKF